MSRTLICFPSIYLAPVGFCTSFLISLLFLHLSGRLKTIPFPIDYPQHIFLFSFFLETVSLNNYLFPRCYPLSY